MVVRALALEDGSDSFQARPRVDRRLRKRDVALGRSLVLHEDQVPDLHEFVGLAERFEFLRRELIVPLRLRPHVVVNLRAGAAGSGIGHLPEVVLVAESQHSLDGNRRQFRPELGRLVVGMVHRRPEAIRLQAQLLCDEFPGEADRVALEIVPEREIAEHLEERVVPSSPPDLLEVVLLSTHAKALLRGDRPCRRSLLFAHENALELYHARVGEQQSGIVLRHERTAGHMNVSLSLEILYESPSDFAGGHFVRSGRFRVLSPLRPIRRKRGI